LIDGGPPKPDRHSIIESAIALRDILRDASPHERDLLMADLMLVARFRQGIKETRPQAVIAIIDLTNVRVLLATMELNIPVLVSEQIDPRFNIVGPGLDLLRRRMYPRASYVVALTSGCASFFDGMNGIRCEVIPSPVLPAAGGSEEAAAENDGFRLIAMGRLSHQKGFDLLLRAFALLADKHPRWTLEIWGQGDILSYLRELAELLGVTGRVRFAGFTRSPHLAMRRADIFVLSSLCEGFPNVLGEAMAAGLPAVSFDCPSGPRDIIRDGVDGLLVPPRDYYALAEALDHVMSDEDERRRLAARAPEVVQRFAIDKVMGMWEQLLGSASCQLA